MKLKNKIAIAMLVGSIGLILMVNHLFDKKDVPQTQIEEQITSEIVESSTTTTTTTKTTKKVTKTTKKKNTTKVIKVATASYNEYQKYAQEYGEYNTTQMSCLVNLWNKESGWNPNSVNKTSGACGIPQAYPCSKIKKSEGSNDWKAQIRWGIKYVNSRYKTPCGAWKHFQQKGWY